MTAPRRGSARAARLRSTDARAVATQRLLVDALKTVVRTEGFGQASATRIAREAGLSRSGFYEHFANVDDLSLFVLDDLLSQATEVDLRARVAPDADRRSLPERAVEVLLDSILQNREFYRCVLLSDRAGGVVGRAMERFAQSARPVVEAVRPGQPAARLDLYAASIGGTVLGVVMHYLRTEDDRSAPELAREVIGVLPAWMYPASDSDRTG
jgi:AcrR family transcriptional regulator